MLSFNIYGETEIVYSKASNDFSIVNKSNNSSVAVNIPKTNNILYLAVGIKTRTYGLNASIEYLGAR